MTGAIRIIGGRLKGKKIPVIAQSTLRPTPNRVRETLFNWLMQDIRGAVCLDAFAGSGALGLEAFSRGAKQVILLEKDLKTYEHLKKIIQSIGAEPAVSVFHTHALDYLKKTQPPFDIIFLDPPFQSNELPLCLDTLAYPSNILTPRGLVYIESSQPPLLDQAQWIGLRQQQAGSVYYGLYQRQAI